MRRGLCSVIFFLLVSFGSVFAQSAFRDDSSHGSIAVLSVPSSASVSVNGISAGHTPLDLPLPAGTHVVSLSLPGYYPITDTVVIVRGRQLLHTKKIVKIPIVSVLSTPANAQVIVDSVFIGSTPIDSLLLAPGQHQMIIRMDDFKDRDFLFDVTDGADRHFVIHLTPTFGFLTTLVSPAGTALALDGADSIAGPIINRKISTGIHRIRAVHSDYEHSISGSFIVGPGTLVTTSAELDRFSLRAFEFSVLVPGLGQMMDASIVKGAAELLATTAAGYWLYTSREHATEKDRAFIGTKQLYEAAWDESSAASRKAEMRRAASELERAKRTRTASYVAFGVSYLATLADALIFHSENKFLSIESSNPLPINDGRFLLPDTKLRLDVPLH